MNTRPGRATTLLASGLNEHLIGGTMGGAPSAAPETGTSEKLIGRSGLMSAIDRTLREGKDSLPSGICQVKPPHSHSIVAGGFPEMS